MVGREVSIRSRLSRTWNIAPRALLRWLALASRRRIVSVKAVAAVRILGIGRDPLITYMVPVPAGPALGEPLASHLADRELGTWALGPGSLACLRELVSRDRPKVVLEFGSGISTAVLALAMRDAATTPEGQLLVSIEQDATEAKRTRQLLDAAGLSSSAVVVVAPIGQLRIEGSLTTCYVLPEDLDRVFGGRTVDLVVVDGPAAEAGARFGTLPLARPFLGAQARFVLDDALRDSELRIAQRWRSLPYVTLRGIMIVEHGLLHGEVQGPR